MSRENFVFVMDTAKVIPYGVIPMSCCESFIIHISPGYFGGNNVILSFVVVNYEPQVGGWT